METAIVGHYEEDREHDRLSSVHGQLEFVRSCDLLHRYLPPAPATVLDVGGGTGPYAFHLARAGYRVHLVDPVPLHVERARALQAENGTNLESIRTGDARALDFEDATADAVLMMGPLYHLTERADRLQALREVRRVLKPGGVVFAVGISRFASALDGLLSGHLRDAAFLEIVEQDLADGQHRNPANHPAYFTTAFFHHPDELLQEVTEAGFTAPRRCAIEGPYWLMENLEAFWRDAELRERLLGVLRRVEEEPSLMGAGAHFMVIGTRPRE